jgi:predicted ATPase/DNA-binding SARP family transcriptional activator/class 3 adenylate cyclase
VQFRILGPLEVLDDHGRPLALGGAKQRALLAVLLLHAGQVVSADRLIDALWGEDPPETARSVLQVYVANLRKVLEPTRPKRTSSSLLRTQPPGYLLNLDGHALDLDRFERLAAEGRAALAAGDPAQTARLLREAVELWRGPALADLALEPFAQAAVIRLEEQRLGALEDRIDADLACGGDTKLVGELEALVTAHPLRERLRGQLLLAFYRSGRQAEALAAYQQTRQTLADELGIDPSPPLQQLQRAILTQDPALDWAPPGLEEPVRLTVPAAPAMVTASTATTPEPASEELLDPPLRDQPIEMRRTITVLCLGISATRHGKELDPELLRDLETSYLSELRAVLERHGGTIQGLRGQAPTVIFGYPVLHENDPLRAVRAATEAREAVRRASAEFASTWKITLAVSAGLQTGEVVITQGDDGRPLLTGATPRLARQLEQSAAPGEVLLGTTTYGLVRDAVRIEAGAPLAVRGRGEPLAAWRLLTVHPHTSGHARRLDIPMVGRVRELSLLDAAFQRSLADRACQLVTVLGLAGVGKSRLAAELLTQAAATRPLVLSGRCLDYGEGTTFWPIGELVRQAAGVTDADTNDQVRAKLAGLLVGDAQAMLLTERVAALIGLVEASAPAEELNWALRRLLEALARHQPLIVVLDDLHWAEPALLDLVDYLADWVRNAPLLLVCLARPELLDARPGWGGGKLNATSILLEPLGGAECSQLVDHLLAGPGAEPVRARITAAAEGNPLYVEELVAMLIEDGLLTHADGQWITTGALDSIPVPPTTSALLAARLDRLADEERTVIERASVVGQVFYRGAVVELAPGPVRPAVPAHLLTLVRKQLVRPDPAGLAGDDAFRFRHLLIRDAAYQALSKRERARLHERFAGWLEHTVGERIGEYEEIIGYHLEEAHRYRAELGPVDDRSQTLATHAAEHLGRAGHRAVARGDMAAAVGLLTRARELASSGTPLWVELTAALGGALLDVERMSDAEKLLTQAVQEAAARGARRVEARARLDLAFLQLLANPGQETGAVREEAELAIAAFEALGDDAGLARAWYLLALVHARLGEVAGLREAAARALTHARRTKDFRQWGQTVVYFGGALLNDATPLDEVIQRFEALQVEAEANPFATAGILLLRARADAMRGRFAPARALLADARNLIEELGLRLYEGYIAANYVAPIESLAGDFAVAEQASRLGYELSAAFGDRLNSLGAGVGVAEALVAQGRFDEALAWTEKAGEAALSTELALSVWWRCVRAKALAGVGRGEHARELATGALQLAERTDDLSLRADSLVDLAEVLRLTGRPREAEPLAEQALRLHERKGSTALADRVRVLLAKLSASA